VAIVTLIVNDRILKPALPGFITGKLSDIAGLVFFPLLVVAVAELAASGLGRWSGPSRRWMTLAVAVTGLGFAAIKLLPAGETAYEVALGAAQWPFLAVGAVLGGGSAPPLRAVSLIRDPTDLVAIAALWIPMTIGLNRVAVDRAAANRADAATRARSLPGYDLIVGGLSVVLLAGAILDGWAHTHELLALESIVTPWHAVVYLTFVAVAVVLLAPPAFTWPGQGRAAARAAIPAGYRLSVAGIFVFAGMGAADAAWHLAFGIEANAEALLSPTHLGLGLGAALIASGPIRAAWDRLEEPATWPRFLPAVLSVVAIAGVVAFALHVANLFVDPWPRFPYALSDVTWYGPHIGVVSALVPTAIVLAPALLLVTRWGELPPGTMTLLIGGALAGLTFLHDEADLVGAPILGGFVADLLLIALRPGAERWRLQVFGFLAGAGLLGSYFVVLWAVSDVAWSAHLIGGTVVLAGGTGWAIALLLSTRRAAPAAPAEARPSRG
jgi:hypothetical protein